MRGSAEQSRAVEVHHEQAELFRRRYQEFLDDPYSSAFNYGRKKLDTLLDAYLPADGEGKSLLDAGCGAGFHLYTLARRGFSCAGLDAADGMVERARELNPGLDIRQGDVERLPFADGMFDFVISIEVIRYLADPVKCLSEFRRVLKPGGLALVTAMPPGSLTLYPLANKLTSRVQVGKKTRVRQYFHPVRRLEEMARAAGLDPVAVPAAFWGPARNLEFLGPRAISRLLRWWEPRDDRLQARPGLRNWSNHLLLVARRPPEE
jgi:ubiquinone/menaquinone biosynthesis C-methylase UbiE